MIEPLRTVQCGKCQHTLPIFHSESTFVGCNQCHAVSSVDNTSQRATFYYSQSPKHLSGIVLPGTLRNNQGNLGRVIANTVWKNDYMEYFSEEGSSGYTKETWSYHEAILLYESGKIEYIFHDDEGYHEAVAMQPRQYSFFKDFAIDAFREGKEYPENLAPQLPPLLGRKNMTIHELGRSSLLYFVGELPYDPQHYNCLFNLIDTHGTRISIEFEPDDTPETAEYFVERKFDKRGLMEQLAVNPAIKNALEEGQQQQRNYNFWIFSFLGFSVAMLLLMLVAQNPYGNRITEQVTLPATVSTDTTATKSIQPQFAKVVGPFSLRQGVVQLTLEADLPDNAGAWIGVDIIDGQNNTLINSIDKEFYRASGTEYWQEGGEKGVENWSEREVELTQKFRLATTGKYYLKLYTSSNTPKASVVKLSLTDGLANSTLLGIVALVSLIIAGILTLLSYFTRPWNIND